MRAYIGIFEKGELIAMITNIANAPIPVWEALCVLIEREIGESLPIGCYVAWDYIERKKKGG